MRRTDSGQRGWSGSNHYQQFCRGVDNFFLYRERGGRENRAGHFRQHLGNPTTTDERVFSQDLLHLPLPSLFPLPSLPSLPSSPLPQLPSLSCSKARSGAHSHLQVTGQQWLQVQQQRRTCTAGASNPSFCREQLTCARTGRWKETVLLVARQEQDFW